jgi:hypothetical protein
LVVVAVIAVVLALAVSGMFAAHVIKLGGSATPVSPGAPAPTNYTVSFAESGLQTGTSWSISFNLTNSSSSSSMISFSSPNGTFSYTVGSVKGYDATPSSGSVKIAGANPSTIEIAFALSNGARSYDTNFTEQGLASGQSWGVTLNGTTLSSTDSTISFTEPNGKYAYTVDPVSGYHFSPASGTVTVAGSSPGSVLIIFTPIGQPEEFSVAFEETGLPAGTDWSVTLAEFPLSSTTASLLFTETNGSYPYSVSPLTGYLATPSSGTVLVMGHDAEVTVVFEVAAVRTTTQFPLNFSETGLVGSFYWEIDCGVSGAPADQSYIFGAGDDGTWIEMSAPNGSYSWEAYTNLSLYPEPVGGSFTVSGAAVRIAVTFSAEAPAQYPVTFTETGLPASSNWTVAAGYSSITMPAGNPIVFEEPNGSTYYSVLSNATGFAATGPNAMFEVDGTGVTIPVMFAHSFTVNFTATGLIRGSESWEVGLNNSYDYSYLGAPLLFNVTNGTYPFYVYADGYSSAPSYGNITVNGHGLSESIVFTLLLTHAIDFKVTGSVLPLYWEVELVQIGGAGFFYSNISSGSSQDVFASAGNYSWYVVPYVGYFAEPGAGMVWVNGNLQTVDLRFVYSPDDQLVEFDEADYLDDLTDGTGAVPSGATWSVTLNGTTESSSGAYIVFAVADGSYSYSITPPAGYAVLPQFGNLSVTGSGGNSPQSNVIDVFVAFAPLPSEPASPAGGGSPAGFLSLWRPD